MRVDQSLPAQNLCESFQLQIFCGRYGWLVCRQGSFLVLVPLLGVGAGFNQGVADHVFNAHSCLGVAGRGSAGRCPRALGILTQGKLDARLRPFENQTLCVLAPPELYDLIAASDRIGAAVEDVGRRNAPGQVPVDVDIFGINHVFNPDHGGDRQCAFIDPAADGDVGVTIDDSRHDILALRVDHRGAFGRSNLGADLGDFALANENGPFGKGRARDRKNEGVFYD